MNLVHDLHTHSTASDGALTPEELVKQAHEAGINTLALTDHDTVDGLNKALVTSNNLDIIFINGIELSTKWLSYTVHIVGLHINPESESLIQHIKHLKELREQRAMRIGELLEKVNIPDAYNHAKILAGDGTVTRSHFAQYLVEAGFAKDQKDVFKRYLVKGKPGFVSVNWPTLEETIKCIHQSNGLAVIAHPLRYKMTATKLRQLMTDFKSNAGDGIEVISGQQNQEELNRATALCKQFDLLASAGSDFHNHNTPWAQLGKLNPLPSTLNPVWQYWNS